MARATLACLALSLVLPLGSACDGGDRREGPSDAGSGADAGSTDRDGIDRPAAPRLEPCPEGWRARALDGATVCDPWPEEGPEDCEGATVHRPGTEGCMPVGPACAEDGFATDLPADADVIHVTSAPGAGGDGSRERPYHGFDAAFRGSSPGAVMALDRGTHVLEAGLAEAVTFWGGCAGGTVLELGFDSAYQGVITVTDGAEVTVRNATIRGPSPGVRLEGGGSVRLEHVVFEGTGVSALWLVGGSRLEGRDVVIRDGVGDASGFGRAVTAVEGSTAVLEGAVIERMREMGIQVADEGSRVELRDGAIRDTRPQATDDAWGRALEVLPGGTAVVERVAIEGNLEFGVFASGTGSTASLRDVVIRGTRPRASDGQTGRGLSVQEGAHATAERVWIEDNRELGVYVSSEEGEGGLELRDAVVRGTRPREDGVGGRGIQVQWGASLLAERVVVADNQEHGVFIATEGTRADLSDLRVFGTRPAGDGTWGRGMEVLLEAQATLERAELESNHDLGLAVTRGAVLDVRAVRVEDTASRSLDGTRGRGVSTQQGSRLTGAGLRIVGNRGVGLYASASDLELADVRVEGTAPQACADECDGGGIGIVSIYDARVTLDDFRVADNTLAGLFLQVGGRLALSAGEVVGHPIGIHTGDEDIDFDAVFQDVRFVDNDRNVDATILPLPVPSDPGEVRF